MTTALALVAHPDDETLWMGGTILKHKDWNWNILSLCRKEDLDRMPKFQKVCSLYGAKGIISDLEDEDLKPLAINKIVSKIKEVLPEKEFDYLFTHGTNGEYGHLRHEEIHKAVKQMLEQGELTAKKAYSFSYVPGNITAPHDLSLKIPIPNTKADLFVPLTKQEFEKKFMIMNKVYCYQEGIFETLACNDTEAFSELK